MKYLLDTHIFLYWLNDDKKLSKNIKEEISNPNNVIFISVVSAWEMSIKLKLNPKFFLGIPIAKCFTVSGFEVVDIKLDHVLQMHKLPWHHKDPFDRMLVAQAKAEGCILVTDDGKIKR